MLVWALLPSLYFLPVVFASDGPGYIGEELGTALDQRAKKTGEKFIVTPNARNMEKSVGTRNLLDKEVRSTVIRGWTILHLLEEDITAIEQRTKQNLAVWEPLMANHKFRAEILAPKLGGADFAAVNIAFSQFCGVSLRTSFSQRVFIFLLDRKGTPDSVLCRDYMLILAAHDITVRRQKDGLLVADLHTRDRRSD